MENRNQSRLHQKLSFTYTFVVLLVVVVLTSYFIYSSRKRTEEANVKDNRRMLQTAADYLTEASGTSSFIQAELYRSYSEMEDMCRLLTEDSETYQKYRLDAYVNSNAVSYADAMGFLEKTFEAYPDIVRIELVSYTKESMIECYPNGSFWPGVKGGRLEAILDNSIEDEDEFSFRREIRDLQSGVSVGCMVLVFDAAVLEEIYQNEGEGSLFVLDMQGRLVWGETPFKEETFQEVSDSDALEKLTHSFVEKEGTGDFVVFALLDKDVARWLPLPRILFILFIGAAMIVSGRLLVNWYLRRLNHRLETIISGMNKVTYGDLSVRLPVNNRGDELDVISSNFNQMCTELDTYIQKSYLAEIERKNAEMQALQSQMNPHFLYNTLEAIRMKAICNGDREVGKMLYSMAVTFRAQLKEKDVITLAQELHYCKNYLVLFEYRYKDRFKVQVDCDYELMQTPVIKFILQPVIENYFVHGIRLEDADNEIHIWAEKENGRLRLHVEDNGKGMDADRLRKMNEDLRENRYELRSSIGVANVNRRIKAVYGGEYGIRLEPGRERGLHVILEIKA